MMKQLNKALAGLAIMSSLGVSAQQNNHSIDMDNVREGETIEYCTQHKKMMELMKNPAYMKIHMADQAILKRAEEDLKNNKQQGTVYTIPVVFHVLHSNGVENISRDQIMSSLDILNRDYRLQNTDANSVVSTFAGMPADIEIEFALATKAPNGTCFSGITRTVTPLTFDGSDGQDQVNAVVSGNDVYNGNWAPNKYLNIYICDEIGGAAGYTFNPAGWSGSSMYYNGIFVQHTYCGDQGTSSTYTSRTLTHEVGHWLNLSHTWGGNNNPGTSTSCSDDDAVDDTPRCIGLTACNLNANTCSNDATDGFWTSDVVDNAENYMDYSYCSKMFTPGQSTRMRAALTSSVAGRNNLWTTSNLNSTGAAIAPLCKAEFYSDKVTICSGDQIEFIDDSYHNVSGWTWTFTGGSPSSSTQQNPTVTYSTPGTYTVALTATDGSTSVSETKTSYITVLPNGRSLPIMEGFESITVPDGDWTVIDNNNNAWQVSSAAGATGSKSLKLSNTTSTDGDIDEFVSNNIDLSNVTDLELSFKYAFVRKSSANTDVLQVSASNDCGESWNVRKNISGTQLPTGTTTGSSYTPSAADWEEVTITNISSSYWIENFRFRFKFTSGGGNNIYIDDINIFDPNTVSVKENDFLTNLRLFPNPTAGNAELAFSLKSGKDVKITMTDMVGKTIEVINTGNLSSGTHRYNLPTAFLSSGVYFINLEIDGAIMTQKLIVE